MTSRRCIVASPVSAKKPVYYWWWHELTVKASQTKPMRDNFHNVLKLFQASTGKQGVWGNLLISFGKRSGIPECFPTCNKPGRSQSECQSWFRTAKRMFPNARDGKFLGNYLVPGKWQSGMQTSTINNLKSNQLIFYVFWYCSCFSIWYYYIQNMLKYEVQKYDECLSLRFCVFVSCIVLETWSRIF